jgi:hypothetical protein
MADLLTPYHSHIYIQGSARAQGPCVRDLNQRRALGLLGRRVTNNELCDLNFKYFFPTPYFTKTPPASEDITRPFIFPSPLNCLSF